MSVVKFMFGMIRKPILSQVLSLLKELESVAWGLLSGLQEICNIRVCPFFVFQC